ncbi:hypothetical protein ACJJTC_008375 [Scirpophaga incertulas]
MNPIILFVLCYLSYSPLGECSMINDNENVLIEAFDNEGKKFKPDWKDLDTRVLPEWYDKAKIGIFLHWGLYSVPGFRSEWFWNYWSDGNEAIVKYMNNNYPPGFTYQDFAPMFKAEFFEPNNFAELFFKAGAKYVVLTSKHHEGFTLFPSKRSFSWNVMDTGPHRDLVGDLSKAVKQKGLMFGVYHSLYEWYNPIYLEDRANNFTTHIFSENKLWPDLKQLVEDYEPSVIWADGDWEAYDTYWKSQEFLAWLYNDSPVKNEVVVNDRWGIGLYCKHGDFYNCYDRYNPGQLQNHKWENAFTLDLKSWGYRKNMDFNDVMSINKLLEEVVTTVSCGGNALINVGPTKEGTIAPIFQERLLELGEWLSVNGDAIYESSPWMSQNDSYSGTVWYTCKKTRYNGIQPTAKPRNDDTVTDIYAVFLEWPRKTNHAIVLADISNTLAHGKWTVTLLGNEEIPLRWETGKNGKTVISLPGMETVTSRHAWTLKFAKHRQ